MPSYERWGCFKIVDSNEQNVKETSGIEGSLINALERGESIIKAKQSLINAGYDRNEVEDASKRVASGDITPIEKKPSPPDIIEKKPVSPSIIEEKVVSPPQVKAAQQTHRRSSFGIIRSLARRDSKNLTAILVVLGLLIIVDASILGIFWSKMFS